jgi:hypothetical protein
VSRLLASEPFEAAGTNTPLAFETRQPDGTFQRFLRLDGERAYYLGPGCDTCGFVFVRQGGANRSVSTTPVADELPQGVDRLDRGLLDAVGDIVPSGRYRATLVEIVPELVRPGEQHDYFAHEQVAIWGIDPFWACLSIRRRSTTAG